MKLKRFLATTVSLVMIAGVVPATSFAGNLRAATAVSYVDRSWDGEKVVSETRSVTDYTRISDVVPQNEAIELTNGKWYVADSGTTLPFKVNCSGTVNLIICDSIQLTVRNVGGISVPENATLNIYGQANDSGTLMCTSFQDPYCAGIGGGKGEFNGNINIYGGRVEAIGGDKAAGIGSGNGADMNGTICVFGGTVSASCTNLNNAKYGTGIGSGYNGDMNGDVIIYSGTVTAKGIDSAGIGAASFDTPGKGNMTGSVTVYSGTLSAICSADQGDYNANDGAGIGTSVSSSSKLAGGEFTGSVKILGGTVTLNKGMNDNDYYSYVPAIGSAKDTSTGTIEIADDLCVTLGGNAVEAKNKVAACCSISDVESLSIKKCDHSVSTFEQIDDDTHSRTCYSCNYTAVENHSYDSNETCTYCNYSRTSETRLAGYTLSLEGDIGLNFHFEISESDVTNNDPYVEFTIPSGSSSVKKKVYVNEKSGEERELARVAVDASTGKTRYIFKCPVAAKEMTSEIKALLVHDDTQGAEYKYSVKEYADTIIANQNNTDYAGAVPLVKAMLNYGGYSQDYFKINLDRPKANAGLQPYEIALGTVNISHENYVISNLPEGVTFEGTSLYLKSGTTLSLYFKNKSGNDVTFKLDGKVIQPKENKGFLQIDITDIKANQLTGDFTISIGESGSVKYGPMNYCKSILDNSQDDTLKNVVKALYKYAVAADDYSNNNA